MSNRHLAAVLATVALSACSVGGRPETDPVGTHPAGMETTVRTKSDRDYRGELLAAEDTALVLLVGSRIVRVSNDQAKRVSFPKLGEQFNAGQWSKFTGKASDFTRIRLRSRYPQGITPDLETRLLAAYGAPGIENVR